MFSDFMIQTSTRESLPKEGDLYKEVTVEGLQFRLLYGYYEDFDRQSPFSEPIPIYPDFTQTPHYTKRGQPLATAMQDVCARYQGKEGGDSCSDCLYFHKKQELFGVCTNPSNKLPETLESKTESKLKPEETK